MIWPSVVNWLLETLPTLDGWGPVKVFDGPAVTGDNPTDYIQIGWVQDDHAGNWDTAESESGRDMDVENGTIRSTLVVQTGNDPAGAMATLRGRAAPLVDVLKAKLRDDQTLGGLLLNPVVSLSADVQPIQNSNGSALELILTVTYQSYA